MIKYLIPILFLSSLTAENNKINIEIDGMQCSYSCASKVSKVVKNIEGVQSCEVDFASSTAVIVFNDAKTNSSEIINTLNKKTYYKANVKNDKNKGSSIWINKFYHFWKPRIRGAFHLIISKYCREINDYLTGILICLQRFLVVR